MAKPHAASEAIGQKLWEFGRKMAYRSPIYQALLDNEAPRHLARPPRDIFAGDAQQGQRILRGQVVLAGRDYALPDAAAGARAWLGMQSPLALVELHQFRWLRHLHAMGGQEPRQAARQYLQHWLHHFGHWHETTWRLDILAERLTGWLVQYGFYGTAANSEFQAEWLQSTWRQVRHLERLYQNQSFGTEKLRAIKALLFAAFAFGDPYLPTENLIAELQEWLMQQIAPDGTAICRSPRLQAQILADLLEIRGLFTQTAQPLPPGLAEAILATARALRHLRHGDGGLALFHHSFEDRADWLDLLLITSNLRGRAGDALEDGGYPRLHAGRSVLLIDAGVNRCPHSEYHHSAMAMEFSVGRERIIVNCGSGLALSADWQKAGLSPSAHSSLDFPNLPPADPCQYRIERQNGEGKIWLQLEHDGWANSGIVHRRQIFMNETGDDIRGEDWLQRQAEFLAPQDFILRFHLHPKIQASATANSILLRTQSGQGWRLRVSGAALGLENGIYLGQIGQLQKTQQITLRGELLGREHGVKWAIQKEGKKS